MKIENEIVKLSTRIELLESQNARFKNLLNSALDISKPALVSNDLKSEARFLEETIKIIEDEKAQLQEDLLHFKKSESDGLLVMIKELEAENSELKKKVHLLLDEARRTSKDVSQLKMEHVEFKFLLTQPESNADWLKTILNLDNSVAENVNSSLMEQRYKLQHRIFTLERNKMELLNALEDIQESDAPSSRLSPKHKREVERIVYRAVEVVAKKEYEHLYSKISELEQERSNLLNELQQVLERSRKQIADEYRQLQRQILEIEHETTEIHSVNTVSNQGNHDRRLEYHLMNELNDGESFTDSDGTEEEVVDKILNAFVNPPAQPSIREAIRRENSSSFRLMWSNYDYCNIL
ncbi:unnamed protein product [Phyllotreta striolata]|uniref:Uncharacterized protein n=1 Tax=Phyllotreta striolata TaxID=444603 RepID=A0A9N9TL10_PHYSR|nr:unnamed protein product [Phyllotreta striolata]